MHILQFLDEASVPALVIAGIVIGFYLPVRFFNRPGFAYGVVICSILTVLFSVMAAYLLASWGEWLLGSKWGVPIGATIGSLFIAIAVNCLAGLIGQTVYAWLKH